MRVSLFFAVVVVAGLGCSTPQLVDPTLPEPPADLRTAFEEMAGGAEARIRILDDNVDAWIAQMNVLEAAQERIDVLLFIVEPDAFGLAWLGLAEKARAGVKVRLMVDARGCAPAVGL